jgi:hypothetical protein
MANKICVGGNDYVKNELWMETFLDLCYDEVCKSSDIINRAVSFQNNILREYYPDLDINDIDKVVKLIEKKTGETVYGKVKKIESGSKENIRDYIVFVNKMYNKLINLAAPAATSRPDDQLPDDDVADSDDTADTADTADSADSDDSKATIIPESKKTVLDLLTNSDKLIQKNYKENKKLYQDFSITEKTIKQIYNYTVDNIEKCTTDYIRFGIDSAHNFTMDANHERVTSWGQAALTNSFDECPLLVSPRMVHLFISVIEVAFVEIFGPDSAIVIKILPCPIGANEAVVYCKWYNNLLSDGKEHTLDVFIDKIKSIENINVEFTLINVNPKKIKVRSINKFNYLEGRDNVDPEYYYCSKFNNHINTDFSKLDFSEYDKHIYPLVMSSKYEMGFHGHIINNKFIVSKIDEEAGGLNSIQVYPMDFIIGHTHPFSRYSGLDIEEPSESDINIFIFNSIIMQYSAISIIAAPEGLYLLAPISVKFVLMTGYTLKDAIDKAEAMTNEYYVRTDISRITFRTVIDYMKKQYLNHKIKLYFRPTPGFNIDRPLNRRATMFSLPNEVFKEQLEISDKLSFKFFINADYEEIDNFNIIKAGMDAKKCVFSPVIIVKNKIKFAPYGNYEFDMNSKDVVHSSHFNNISIRVCVINCYDEIFPFSISLTDLKEKVQKFFKPRYATWVIILSDSYITIVRMTKNEIYGPLDRETKEYISYDERNRD